MNAIELTKNLLEDQFTEMSLRPGLKEHEKRKKQEERDKRHQIVIWKKPIVTLKYFLLESLLLLEIERKKYV